MGYILDLRKILGTRPIIMTGSCVLVFNADGYLLLQKRSDTLDWGTIGGSLELGESLEEAAARELFEEAGLTAKTLRFIALLSGSDLYYKYPHGDETYSVIAVYEAIGVEGTPTTAHDDEGLELRYFSLQDPIPDLNPFTALVLRKAGYL
jgi:8-oxo-dGTP pyrophosphatase MutT (NUDIX family)